MDRMTMQPTYQPATLSIEQSGMWRICWYNLNPATGKLERIRKTFNLNRVKAEAERRRVANQYISLINEALKNGYNDFEETSAAVMAEPEISLVAALQKALQIRCLGKAERTAGTYRSIVNTLTTWLWEAGLNKLPLSKFTADHYQEYLFYKSELGHGNRNLNDHTNFFKTTFDVICKKQKLLKENPVAEIDYLPEHESILFEPLTLDEIAAIVPALIEYNPRFYLYTRFIAYQFIRPWHIARLKAGSINYRTAAIRVSKETTKNRKTASKQLLQPIQSMLQEMGYDRLPGHYYLFGKNFEPSRELYPTLSVRAAEAWKRIVIDGLGINKKMYALKHTSSQYFVNENESADLKFLQQQLEHHSMTQTEIYLQDKIFKRVDEGKTKFLNY